MKTKIEQISDVISPALTELGVHLVDVRLYSHGEKEIVDVRLERLDGKGITIGEIEKATRHISTLLDVEDVIPNTFVLEVGSAGLDRPLKILEDFKRFIGKSAKIETLDLIEGRKRFKGMIESIEQTQIKIKMDEGTFIIPLESIEKARLVI